MNKKIIYGICAAVAALLIIWYIYSREKMISDMSEQYEIEKESLEEEYSQLAIQYEGYKLNVDNDSLAEKLENERLKVSRLVDELKTTKATNARRINELKKELTTVRGVLRTYIAQVDSLNRINEKLTEENRIVRRKYEAVTQSADSLKKAKEELTQQVSRAAKLDAILIKGEALTSRNKHTDKLSRAEKFHLGFVLGKNVTAEVGEKEIFVRILKPDEEVLVKDMNNLFGYEDQQINYSMKKTVEYTGEECQIDMYWNIEEFLFPGQYRMDIFADGNLIGKTTFEVKK